MYKNVSIYSSKIEKKQEHQEYQEYLINYVIASAPPKPWYYDKQYKYTQEVINKAHTVLIQTWHYLPFEWQKYYLDYYTYKFQKNDL